MKILPTNSFEDLDNTDEEDNLELKELPKGMKSMSMEDVESFRQFTNEEKHLVTEDTEAILSRAHTVVWQLSKSKSSEH